MRKIRIISTQSDGVKTIESSASTWGELKSELSSSLSNVQDMKAIVRDTRNTLESDEAVLPEGDFTIILTMKKIASGSEDKVTRYSKSQILEIRTKILNLIDDLLDYEENLKNDKLEELTEEDIEELEKLRQEGLI